MTLILYLSVKVSGVVYSVELWDSELEYVPVIVEVIVGNFAPIAFSIISLDSINFSNPILTLGLFLTVLAIVSSIFNACNFKLNNKTKEL